MQHYAGKPGKQTTQRQVLTRAAARGAIAAFATSMGNLGTATADVYPSHPITVVVPYAAGGPADTLARILAERMRVSLGQALIIENVTGAAGATGVGRVARAAPDGYTLSIGNWGTHVLNGALYTLKYDLLKDTEPVALLTSNPQAIVAKKTVPAKDLKELVAWLKASQAKVSAGTAGFGSPSHVGGIYFQNRTGAEFQFVSYRGTGPAMQDLVAGHIDLIFDQASNALPHVQSGNIKAFAVTAKNRLSTAPDIPTVDEAGVPELYISVWFGLWAPKGTPQAVVAKLNSAVVDALGDPAVRQRLSDLGQEIPPRELQTPEALGIYQRAEIEKWWPIIKAANIKAE